MPSKGKKKAISEAVPEERRRIRTTFQQHEVERRIKTDAENALCEAMSRVREWITEGGDKGTPASRAL